MFQSESNEDTSAKNAGENMVSFKTEVKTSKLECFNVI